MPKIKYTCKKKNSVHYLWNDPHRFQGTVMWHHADWYTVRVFYRRLLPSPSGWSSNFKTCMKNGYNIGEGQDKWKELWTNISGGTQHSEQLKTSTL